MNLIQEHFGWLNPLNDESMKPTLVIAVMFVIVQSLLDIYMVDLGPGRVVIDVVAILLFIRLGFWLHRYYRAYRAKGSWPTI